MYKLNILDDIKVPINWSIVYCGIKNCLLDIEVAKDYAMRLLEKNDDVSQEELDLAWGLEDKLKILEKIEKIPHIQLENEENMEQASNAIRIAILSYIRKSEKCLDDLFQKVDIVYADFNYPADMEGFISYMPINNEHIIVNPTREENEKRLLDRIDSFISEQIKKYK
jgi:hypothetical protein